jgi:hypothetical protein
MRTNKPKRTNLWRIFSRRSTRAHNAWLILNMEQFNFEGSLSRVLARQQAQLFGRWERRSKKLRRNYQNPSNPSRNFIDVNTDSESIVVNAPVSEVYHRCLRFEDFPAFINSISKMDRIDNTHFSCTWSINGEEVQSDVQIIMRVADRRIAWQAASDHFRVGVVFFVPIGGAATKVTVKVRSIVEPVRLTGALRHYLRNFKVYIENDTEGKSAFARPRSPSWMRMLDIAPFSHGSNSDNAPASQESTFTLKSWSRSSNPRKLRHLISYL